MDDSSLVIQFKDAVFVSQLQSIFDGQLLVAFLSYENKTYESMILFNPADQKIIFQQDLHKQETLISYYGTKLLIISSKGRDIEFYHFLFDKSLNNIVYLRKSCLNYFHDFESNDYRYWSLSELAMTNQYIAITLSDRDFSSRLKIFHYDSMEMKFSDDTVGYDNHIRSIHFSRKDKLLYVVPSMSDFVTINMKEFSRSEEFLDDMFPVSEESLDQLDYTSVFLEWSKEEKIFLLSALGLLLNIKEKKMINIATLISNEISSDEIEYFEVCGSCKFNNWLYICCFVRSGPPNLLIVFDVIYGNIVHKVQINATIRRIPSLNKFGDIIYYVGKDSFRNAVFSQKIFLNKCFSLKYLARSIVLKFYEKKELIGKRLGNMLYKLIFDNI